MTYLASDVSGNSVSASPNSSYWQKIHQSPWVMGQVSFSWDHLSNTRSSYYRQQNGYWHANTMMSTAQGKFLTSLLRQAFKCNGFLDMKNCQVVSAQGWGPGCSGAYCTLRISRRAEFLGSSRGEWGGTLCLAEAGVLHSHVLTPKKSNDKWGKAE